MQVYDPAKRIMVLDSGCPRSRKCGEKSTMRELHTHRKAGSTKEGHPNISAPQIKLVEVYAKPEQSSQLRHF